MCASGPEVPEHCMEKSAGHRNFKTSHSFPQGFLEEAQEERDVKSWPEFCAEKQRDLSSLVLLSVIAYEPVVETGPIAETKKEF